MRKREQKTMTKRCVFMEPIHIYFGAVVEKDNTQVFRKAGDQK